MKELKPVDTTVLTGGIMAVNSGSIDKADATRRKFLKICVNTMGAIGTLVLGIPFLDALIKPSLRIKVGRFVDAGPVSVLPEENPRKVFFDERDKDAYIEQTARRDVWAIKHTPENVTIFSPICPHLGCRYNWDPATHHFECPCHGSVWTKEGKVIGGPSPRPLDTLPHRIENGELFVKWERFKIGVRQKIIV